MSNKHRSSAATAVARAFLPLEAAAASTAEQGANCIAVMLSQRTAARLHPETGSDVLILVARSMVDALRAHRKLARAHHRLAGLARELEVGFGDDGCPDNKPRGAVVPLFDAA